MWDRIRRVSLWMLALDLRRLRPSLSDTRCTRRTRCGLQKFGIISELPCTRSRRKISRELRPTLKSERHTDFRHDTALIDVSSLGHMLRLSLFRIPSQHSVPTTSSKSLVFPLYWGKSSKTSTWQRHTPYMRPRWRTWSRDGPSLEHLVCRLPPHELHRPKRRPRPTTTRRSERALWECP